MTPQQVEQLIQTGLPDAQVSVMSEDDTHFEAMVISSQFAGQAAVAASPDGLSDTR